MDTLPELAERMARKDYDAMMLGSEWLPDNLFAGFIRRIGDSFEEFYDSRRNQYLEQAREAIADEVTA